jgi:hypothetical protein
MHVLYFIFYDFLGDMLGTVEFKVVEESRIKMKPMKFELGPCTTKDNKQKVKIFYTNHGKDVGVRREAVEVLVTGGNDSVCLLMYWEFLESSR